MEHRRHPEAAPLGNRALVQLEAPGGGGLGQRAGDGSEHQAKIVDAPSQRSVAVDVGLGQRAGRSRDVTAARDDTPRRLETVDAVVVRRIADRTADVAAQLDRGEPGGHRRGRAARRSARGPRRVPRVVGHPVHLVEGLQVTGVERGVGLAEDDRPGRLEPAHRQGIAIGHVIPELGCSRGGDQPLRLPDVLHRHREPMQRRDGDPGGGDGVGGIRRLPGRVRYRAPPPRSAPGSTSRLGPGRAPAPRGSTPVVGEGPEPAHRQ